MGQSPLYAVNMDGRLGYEGKLKRARAYYGDTYLSDESGQNGEETTLIGCYYEEEVGNLSHSLNLSNSINFCHQQQRRRIVSPVPLSPPRQPVCGHSCSLTGSLDPRLLLATNPSSSKRLNGCSAGYSVSSRLEATPQSRREGRVPSFPSLNPSLRFTHTMTNGRRHRPSAAATSPISPGSDESRTLRGSCSSSHAASQSGAVELMLDTPRDLCYPFSCETTDGDPVIEGLGKWHKFWNMHRFAKFCKIFQSR